MGKKQIGILTDSNSGISLEQGKKYDIGIIPMPFTIEGKEYYEELTLQKEQFFEQLNARKSIKTSQPSIEELVKIFEQELEKYEEIIYIPMSSGLSGSFMTASIVAREYEGRVHVIDNHRISCTQKQSVLEARNLAEQGYSVLEICKILEEYKYKASIYIAVETLDYLKKGGRITKSAAVIGDMLNIRPVLQIQGDQLDAYKKVRGKKAARRALIQAVDEDMQHRFKGKEVVIKGAYCGEISEAHEWQEMLKEHFPEHVISIDPLAWSICCHIGPSATAVVCMEKMVEAPDVLYEI